MKKTGTDVNVEEEELWNGGRDDVNRRTRKAIAAHHRTRPLVQHVCDALFVPLSNIEVKQ
jgi:hypothetical protein